LLPKKGRFSIKNGQEIFVNGQEIFVNGQEIFFLKCRFTKKTRQKHPQKTRVFGRKKKFWRKKRKNKGKKRHFFVNIFYFLGSKKRPFFDQKMNQK